MAVGQAISMVDSPLRVSGGIDFTLNLELPRMLHAGMLRSPHPHARIVRVDASRALKHPGVVGTLTRDDLTSDHIDPYFGLILQDQTPVALDRVRYVGEPVAALAAVDADTAAEALDLIDVEYEELPAVFDAEEALKPGAPVLYPGPRRVIFGRNDVTARSIEGTNIVHLFKQRKGDIAQGFRESDQVFENTFVSPAVNHVALEPHVVVAQVADGRITVWTCTQNPHVIQRQLAGIFKVPIADVRVIVFTLGGGFGGKLNCKLEPAAALLAKKTGRPVRMAPRRAECFLLGVQHECKIKLRTGVKRDGKLHSMEAYCYYNSGAYGDTSPNLITRGYAATGPYRVPHLHMDSYGVYTNTAPSAAFRGYGITQVAWAHETQMDIIADTLGMDPAELRLKNVLQKGDPFTTGEPMPEMHYNQLVESALKKIGWRDGPLVLREGNKIHAKGIGVIIKGMATPTTSTSTVKLNADGSLNVLTSSVEMGQGLKTALAQIAASEIGLPVGRVRVSEPDTAFTPFDLMTAASRATFCMGTAIREAIADVKNQLRDIGAARLEANRDDLVLQDGKIMVRGVAGKSLSYVDAIRAGKASNILGHGVFVSGSGPDGSPVVMDFETGQGYGSAEWHPAVVVCEVEVDTETGDVTVPRIHAELYAGKVINPRLCELQIQGATTFGLGQVLFEELVRDTNGSISNPNLSDYMIPSFHDVPAELSVHMLEPHGVTDVHGVGETAIPPARPAIGNAISRAVGTHFLDLPITPEKILRALQKHGKTQT